MRHDDCIFCKIANGEIPSATIYEDDDFRAFLDLNPATRGHALLVPKDHFANLLELDEGEAGLRWIESGSEQRRSSRSDRIPFSYASDSALRE